MVLSEEVKKLFQLTRHLLGAPTRKVQLEDEQLCDLLDVALGDYAENFGNTIARFIFYYRDFGLFTGEEAINEYYSAILKTADCTAALSKFLSLYQHQFFSASSSSCFT